MGGEVKSRSKEKVKVEYIKRKQAHSRWKKALNKPMAGCKEQTSSALAESMLGHGGTSGEGDLQVHIAGREVGTCFRSPWGFQA